MPMYHGFHLRTDDKDCGWLCATRSMAVLLKHLALRLESYPASSFRWLKIGTVWAANQSAAFERIRQNDWTQLYNNLPVPAYAAKPASVEFELKDGSTAVVAWVNGPPYLTTTVKPSAAEQARLRELNRTEIKVGDYVCYSLAMLRRVFNRTKPPDRRNLDGIDPWDMGGDVYEISGGVAKIRWGGNDGAAKLTDLVRVPPGKSRDEARGYVSEGG